MRWLSWQSTCSQSLQTWVQIPRSRVIAKPCSSVYRALERRHHVGGTLGTSMSLKEMWGPLPLLSLTLLSSFRRQVCHVLLPWYIVSPQTHSNGANWAWTETMSPNQSFLHKLIILGIITMESQLTKKYKMKTNLSVWSQNDMLERNWKYNSKMSQISQHTDNSHTTSQWKTTPLKCLWNVSILYLVLNKMLYYLKLSIYENSRQWLVRCHLHRVW